MNRCVEINRPGSRNVFYHCTDEEGFCDFYEREPITPASCAPVCRYNTSPKGEYGDWCWNPVAIVNAVLETKDEPT